MLKWWRVISPAVIWRLQSVQMHHPEPTVSTGLPAPAHSPDKQILFHILRCLLRYRTCRVDSLSYAFILIYRSVIFKMTTLMYGFRISATYSMTLPSSSVWFLRPPSPTPTGPRDRPLLTDHRFHPPPVSVCVPALLPPPGRRLGFWAGQWAARRAQGARETRPTHANMCLLSWVNLFWWTPSRTWWWKLSEESSSSRRAPALISFHLLVPGEYRHTHISLRSVSSFFSLLHESEIDELFDALFAPLGGGRPNPRPGRRKLISDTNKMLNNYMCRQQLCIIYISCEFYSEMAFLFFPIKSK